MQTVESSGVTTAYNDALRALLNFALGYQEELALRAGIAGDGMGNVAVAGANRRIYVRLGAADGEVAEAQVDTFTPATDDAVLLMRIRIFGLGGWLVKGWLNGTDVPCLPTELQA